MYGSNAGFAHAKLLAWRARAREFETTQSEITRDHLDFHALAREKLARQLLMRVLSPPIRLIVFPPVPPPTSLSPPLSSAPCLSSLLTERQCLLQLTFVFPQEQREEEMRQHLRTLMIAETPAQEDSEHIPEL